MSEAGKAIDILELLEEVIRATVRETVSELRKTGYLRENDKLAYKSMADKLRSYFEAVSDGKRADPAVKEALADIADDYYFPVIILYYRERKTIEQIAEIYNVEVSTITRNKKRLCLTMHHYIQIYF